MLVKQIYFGFFLIFLVASSVYVFEAGLPQPADLLMASLVAVLATGFIVRPPVHGDLMFVGALFVGYAALVNLFWYTQYQTDRFWLTALYYVYDFGALIVVVSLVRALRERFITATRVAIAVAILLEIVALAVLPRTSIRSVGTFNNPNQLGYWGLVVACSWLVLKRDQKLTAIDILVLCGAGYLTAESLSKAAMLAFTLLFLTGMVFQRLTRSAKLVLLAMVFVGASTVLLNPTSVERLFEVDLVKRVDNRLGTIGEQGDDSLAGRGYDRIWRHPEHLVFGAGEGALWRFTKDVWSKDKEIHSTLGTVLFSYGIIGFSLFCALLLMVFRRAPRIYALYSLAIWAYGMTHQGLRDTMLWVFLGLVFGVAHYARSASPTRTELAPEPHGLAPASVRGPGLRVPGATPARS
jgi:hypothetical protein